LGEFSFFGVPITLDPRNLPSPTELRQIAEDTQPGASPELVDITITQLYDTLLDRLLVLTFPNSSLSQSERDAVAHWLGVVVPDQAAVDQALQRHGAQFSGPGVDGIRHPDGTESIAATELSWHSDNDSEDDAIDSDGHTLRRLLYHIAEDRARKEGVIHRGITCNGCDAKPIRGIRYRCANCVDYDLCSDCEATNTHIKTHIFYKIRVPAPYLLLPKQEPVYPGRPHAMSPTINTAYKKKLVSETKMEFEEMEALWDQFTCLAGTEWEADPSKIGWALDRRAFNQAFIPRYSTFISTPNLIYDRIFAYYDTDHNGIIGFEEFVKGLDGMHSADPKVKLKIVFNGYDVDGDGYISRKDVLRMFRAYYAIEKEATRNYLAEASEELSVRGALDTIHSSQPLGSAFTQNLIPGRRPINLQLLSKSARGGFQPMREDIEDTADREEILGIHDPRNSLNEELGAQAVRERWARRQFYVDEEEGLTRPEGFEEPCPESDTEDTDLSPATRQDRPRGSRASSRVRFEDDIDIETRSNASTSSRPVGERWGGYEIPEPEKDLGREVLYQTTQHAFNELLNPLFQEKEDNAMNVRATRWERRRLATQIDEAVSEFKRETDVHKSVVFLGTFGYAKWMLHIITGSTDALKILLGDLKSNQLGESDIHDRIATIFSAAENEIVRHCNRWPGEWEPASIDMWNAKLCRMQFRHEFKVAIVGLAERLNWLPSHTPPVPSEPVKALDVTLTTKAADPGTYRDPTMPQFRPNSLNDLVATTTSTAAADETTDVSSIPSEDDSSTDDSYLGDDVEITHYTRPEGPFFIDMAETKASPDGSEIGSPATVASVSSLINDHLRNPELNSTGLPASPPPPPNPLGPDTSNEPVFFKLRVDKDELSIHAECRSVSHVSPFEEDTIYKPLERKIRRAALDKDSPLHISLLASLEGVQAEIAERKAPGLLSFSEFQEKMAEGKLRFLEAWMDWVSF
ncbi:hypothetical protein EJ04DRAFT_399756, partial [Polyplosphaeria fusca]